MIQKGSVPFCTTNLFAYETTHQKGKNHHGAVLDFWTYGPMFVRELQEHYEEPRPNFNTLSNQVHTLMEDGFLERKAYGSNYQYIPVVSRKAYSLDGFHGLVNEYFDSSYSSVVLGLVEEERLSVDDLKRIIDKIEKRK